MRCAFCSNALAYIHGHAACIKSGCPMYGVNQAECCSGETAACGPLTVEVAQRAPDQPSSSTKARKRSSASSH